jgi:hypothetical protein
MIGQLLTKGIAALAVAVRVVRGPPVRTAFLAVVLTSLLTGTGRAQFAQVFSGFSAPGKKSIYSRGKVVEVDVYFSGQRNTWHYIHPDTRKEVRVPPPKYYYSFGEGVFTTGDEHQRMVQSLEASQRWLRSQGYQTDLYSAVASGGAGGFTCPGAVPGQDVKKRDPDPSILSTLIKECQHLVGGAGRD